MNPLLASLMPQIPQSQRPDVMQGLMANPMLQAGLGLLAAGAPSTTPGNPIGGLLMGLQNASQARAQMEGEQLRRTMLELQLQKLLAPPKQKETDVMANARALGLNPGTPEYNNYIKEQTAKKGGSTAKLVGAINPVNYTPESVAAFDASAKASGQPDYSLLKPIPQRGQTSWGLSPQIVNKGTAEQPEWVALNFSSDGRYKEIPIQGTPTRGMQYDPNLQGDISSAKAVGTTTGTAMGEAQNQLADLQAAMPKLNSVADRLSTLGQIATYTSAGQVRDAAKRELGMDVGDAAVARTEYIAMVDNEVLPLLRQTFGAAFTQKEGESLKVTLGDPNKSPAEKDAVLRAFIQAKVGQIESLQRRVGNESAPDAAAPSIDDLLNKYK